jgi:CheY-like chemotaxis protein
VAAHASTAFAEIQYDPLRGHETVLVVEDEPVIRGLVRGMLERSGFTVLDAGNGDDAILLAATGTRIDLLLTDVVMPSMSGCALAERLQAMLPLLRVLFTSGYSACALREHGMLDHDSRILEKPYAADTLRQSVRDALDDAR